MPVRTSTAKPVSFMVSLWGPVFACMAVIFYASCLTGDDIPGLFPFQDVAYHFSIYLVLGALCSRAIKKSWNIGQLKVIIVTLVLGVLYAVTDEYHQSFVSGRTQSLADLAVDALGNLAGGIIYRWLA